MHELYVNNDSEVCEDILVQWTSASHIKSFLYYEGPGFESIQDHKFLLFLSHFFFFVCYVLKINGNKCVGVLSVSLGLGSEIYSNSFLSYC